MWIPELSKSNKFWKTTTKKYQFFSILSGFVVVIMAGVVFKYFQFTNTHIPPNTYINSIAVGKLSYADSESKLLAELPSPPEYQVTLDVEGIAVASSSAELGLDYDVKTILSLIQNRTTTGKLRWQTWWRSVSLYSPVHETAQLKYDSEKLNNLIAQLNEEVAYPGEEPTATLGISGNSNTLEVTRGKYGRAINPTATALAIPAQLDGEDLLIAATVASPGGQLTDDQLKNAEIRSSKYIDKSIKFYYKNYSFVLSDKEMISMLTFPEGFNTTLIAELTQTWKAKIDSEPQEPEFEYDKTTMSVTNFTPPKDGLSLNEQKAQDQILMEMAAIESPATSAEQSDQDTEESSNEEEEKAILLEVRTTSPTKSLADTNDLGIKELIGSGDSHYDHSIPNRIHNVSITTDRISDQLLAPGQEFSFNKTLGDVSSETGFRSAYVIKNGQTSLGDGGGVCQVSTTLFRSVLDAGLKVTRRLPHSYRVSYYELDTKPGVDATVYSGNVDLRFVNDTENYILIHAEADSQNLYMYVDIYGTSDGRSTEIIDHKTWNYRPAPPAQYIPDPTLRAGTLKQVDWAAPGISASFVNVVKDKDGKVIREDKYVSNYRAWSAKYLQGTAE